MSETEIDRLTPSELLTLAGLLRKLVRMDGRFTEEERAALSRVAQRVAETEDVASPESEVRPKPIGAKALFERIERASEAFPDDQKLRAAALAVTRPDARATMHAILFDVAASDTIGKAEGELLEWLEEKWELDTSSTEDDEADDASS